MQYRGVVFRSTTLGFLTGNVLELKYLRRKAFFVVIKKDQHLAGYRLANYLEFRSGICGEISMQNPSVFDKGF